MLAGATAVLLVGRGGGAGTGSGQRGAAPGSAPASPSGPAPRASSAGAFGSAAPEAAAAQSLSALLVSYRDRLTTVSSTRLQQALEDARACRLGGVVSRLADVVSLRDGELRELQALNLAALPNGTRLRDSLAGALSAARSSDESYRAWVSTLPAVCAQAGGRPDPVAAGAGPTDAAASAGKTAFLKTWGPYAAAHRLPALRSDDL